MSRKPTHNVCLRGLKCPGCSGTNIATGDKLVRTSNAVPGVEATCRDCGHGWKTTSSKVVRDVALAAGRSA